VYALFTRLEQYVFAALVTLALWAAVLVAVPAVAQAQVAQAQEKAPNNKTNTQVAEQRVVVVDPGDTLWSISTEELRPNATPQQIAAGAERIYALNRKQIGPDPSLIFPGQRLLVPSSGSEPSASRRSADSEPPARKDAEAASAGDQPGRQAKHETLGAPRQAAAEVRGEDRMAPESASKPAPLPDAARVAPVPAVRQNTAEEPPRSPDESFVDNARTVVASAASALVGLFPSGEGYEGHTWRELLGAALLAVSSVAFVLTFVLTLALLLAPERAKRAQREDWWREVRAHGRAYERVSFDPSPNEELVNGKTGTHAHANGATHAKGNVPLGMILAAERQKGRRRRGRPQSPARHVRRHARRGLAHLTYSPGMRHFLRGTSGARSGTRPRRPASRASAASRWRFTAESGRTGVGAR
jgi:LysM repeat protein